MNAELRTRTTQENNLQSPLVECGLYICAQRLQVPLINNFSVKIFSIARKEIYAEPLQVEKLHHALTTFSDLSKQLEL